MLKKYLTAGIITFIMLSANGIVVSAQPQQRSESFEISSATVNEVTQELDAAIAHIQEGDPTVEDIQIHCTMDYPPSPGSTHAIIWCTVTWVSDLLPPSATTMTPWQKEIEGGSSNTTESQ